jgi:L-ascorbate metabolism protein UlaG (beta-lactamase superfamily)
VTGLAPWERHRFDGEGGLAVDVTAVPAQHGPPGCEPVSGDVIGFVLEAAGWPTVYVSGDNASVDVLAEIVGRFPRIAVAVLFVGAANVGRFGDANVTLGSTEAAAVAGLLPDVVVLPVHAQDWGHFTEPLSAFMHAYTSATDPAHVLSLPRGVPVDVYPLGV